MEPEKKQKAEQPNGGAEFPKEEDVGPRDWGREILIGLVPGKYSFKKLIYHAGHKGGLQYHHKKDEYGFVVEGQMLVRYDEGDGVLKEKVVNPGEVVHFPQGAVHQEEALTELTVLEVSTPYFNDRVRMEEAYGIESPGGLPSTTIDEVEER